MKMEWLKKLFQSKKPIDPPVVKKELSDKDKLQALFMRMHKHSKNGSFERAKEAQREARELISAIRADKAGSERNIRG